MSLRLLGQLPTTRRVSACICRSSRRLYSAQPALQPLPEHGYEQPTSHDDTQNVHPLVAAEVVPGQHAAKSGEKEELGGSRASSSRLEETSLAKSRVNDWLTRLQLEGIDPTLDDLERCRPESHPPKGAPEYTIKYNELVDTLCRSFSMAQLQKFVRQAGLLRQSNRRTRRKVGYAERIIEEKWGWPRLEEVVRERRDRTEASSESRYPVN